LTTLYFDCFSGAAGDMILGALVDVGVPLDDLRHALGRLAVERDAVRTERVIRAGITATKFSVRDEVPMEHGHSHEPSRVHHHDHVRGQASAVVHDRHTHAHRSLPEIYTLIDGSSLSGAGKDRAKQLFARLGDAEAAIHGTPIDKVHLHEVGALDSIIDIVGTVYALDMLEVDRVVSSALNVGSGSVRSAHGTYPVPAPATAWLLRDAPIYGGPQQAELVTPTGALLVTSYAAGYGPVPPMVLKRVGYGAGTRDFHDAPNVLRVLIGESDSTAPTQSVVVVEAEIDDMNPQIFGVLMDQLLAGGALDVFYTPIQMKKNRPGTLLTVIASPDARQRLTTTIFRETTTIGVRYREMLRECLERETVNVDTPLGTVRIKIARRNGEVLNASPEFDDCARIARERNVPVKDVQAAATKAFLDRRL
jgi:pyridinium-3,5-bisthiocarboxylic acid mononucleotide nickel chelatase